MSPSAGPTGRGRSRSGTSTPGCRCRCGSAGASTRKWVCAARSDRAPMSERIVITEDDEDLAFVLREALRRQRYEADVASTAADLLDRLKTGAYDLILLDVRLPDMDGLDAIPRCRELAPDTPIIVMTAHGTRETAMDQLPGDSKYGQPLRTVMTTVW